MPPDRAPYDIRISSASVSGKGNRVSLDITPEKWHDSWAPAYRSVNDLRRLLEAAPAMRGLLEEFAHQCRNHGFGPLVMRAETLLREIDNAG